MMSTDQAAALWGAAGGAIVTTAAIIVGELRGAARRRAQVRANFRALRQRYPNG